MEKKLNELFESITPKELSLAGDEARIEQKLTPKEQEHILSLTMRKAGITMTDNTQKTKRRFRRTTIIAIAAAAVLSCTAAAAGIIAIHEKSVDRYFGEGAAAELSKKGIMINKVETNDDYKLTVDLAYATDDYARVMFTFEGLNDAAKERIANTTNWYWDIDPHFIDDSRPAFGCSSGALGGIDDKEIDRDKEKGIYTFDVTMEADLSNIESYTLSMIPEEWSDANGVPNTGELNLITVDFELTPNITPITFVSQNANADLWVCDYEIKIPDNLHFHRVPDLWYCPEDIWFNEDNPEGETKQSHNEYYNAHKDDVIVTVIYKDGTKDEFTSQDVSVYEYGLFFKGTSIDSENAERIILGYNDYSYVRK